jgi:predicted double-glycine peptidase
LRGTQPEKALEGLEKLGYRALWFENADLQRLTDLVDHRWPVIVFLRSADLPHGRYGLHAAVVIGFENSDAIMADPVLGQLVRLPVSVFLRAWQALGSQGMVVWR